MSTVIEDRWQQRRGTAANLATVNEVPLEGERIFEIDTGKFKDGDGVTHYNDLPYEGQTVGDAVTALTISSGVVNIDCSKGDYFTLSLTANVTSITFSNVPASGRGQSIMIRVQQDATGSRTVALPTSFKAIAGSDTAIQAAANAYTIIAATTFDQGARWEYSMKAGG